MKKLLSLFILTIAMLHTSISAVYAEDDFAKCTYDASTNSVRWEGDMYIVDFTGNTPAELVYNDGKDRLTGIIFPGTVQVQLNGSFDMALLHQIANGETVSENLFTETTISNAPGEMQRDQTNAVMLTEGEYTLAFIVIYGEYSSGSSISIKVGNGSYSGQSGNVQTEPQVPGGKIDFDRNSDSYFTTMTALPDGAQISDWAVGEVNEAFTKNIIPQSIYNEGNYQKPVTRKEFAYIMVGALQSFNYTFDELIEHFVTYGFSTEFTDTNNDLIVQVARINHVINGTSDTTFSPDGLLTREQAATMLERLYDQGQTQLGATKPMVDTPTYFVDRDKFSDWSVNAINFVSAISEPATGRFIMGGVGNDEFLPEGNLTVEQALIAAKRLISVAEGRYQQIQEFINSQN